jgi:hypothetical protein
VALVELDEPRRNIEARKALHRREAHGSRGRRRVSRVLCDGDRIDLDRLGVTEEAVAGLGEHVTAGGPVKKLRVERFLQLGDAPPDSALIDLQPSCRRRKAPLAGQLEEIAQVVPVEHRRRA